MPAKFEPTIEILKGKLKEASIKKGVEMISKWEIDLEKAEFTGAKTIHSDLGKLKKHLESDDLNGKSIGEMLVKLGHSTEKAASHAKGENTDKLESLGKALVKAGESLSE